MCKNIHRSGRIDAHGTFRYNWDSVFFELILRACTMGPIRIILFLMSAALLFTACNAELEGYFVDIENECVGPDIETIMYVNAKEPQDVSAAMGCYRDTSTNDYWLTTHLIPSNLLRKSSLVKTDECAFAAWDLCEPDVPE